MAVLLQLLAGVGAAISGWFTTYSQTLNADSTAWNGFNLRQHLATSLLSASGSKFRITFEAASAQGAQIDGCYAGHAAGSGDAYDFDGTQVQVTVSASPTFTVPSGSTLLSDEITYAFDNTKAFIVAVHFNNASVDDVRGRVSVTGATAYFKSAANETATSNVSTYSSTANAVRLIQKIEVFI